MKYHVPMLICFLFKKNFTLHPLFLISTRKKNLSKKNSRIQQKLVVSCVCSCFFSMCFPFRKTVLQGQIQKLKSFLDVAHLHLAGNAVKDLPKWDSWDRCWGGLELKYTWNILKRGFYFGSWWFWCSSKGAVSWSVRNQWTPRMAGKFWMIVLDPTTPTTPVFNVSLCLHHHFRAGRPWKFLPSSNTAGKPPV